MEPANIEQRVSELEQTLRAHLVWAERHEDKLDAVLEYVRDIPVVKQDIRELKDRMDAVESELEVISVVVKDHSDQLHRINVRLDRLDGRVGKLGQQVGKLDQRVGLLEQRVGRIESRLG